MGIARDHPVALLLVAAVTGLIAEAVKDEHRDVGDAAEEVVDAHQGIGLLLAV